MAKSRKKDPDKVRVSFQIKGGLHSVLKRLALEQSAERDCPVFMATLFTEALTDLLEKYGKVEPDDRPLE